MSQRHLTYPNAAIIASYKTNPQPYSNYQHNLAALAVALQSVRTDSWTLAPETCNHYVYVYLDPRFPGDYRYKCPSGKTVRFTHRPFYVGKGQSNRIEAHLGEKSLRVRNRKNSKLKAIVAAGFDPAKYRVVTPGRRTDYMSQALEIDLVAGIGRADLKNGPLTNMTDGGDGMTGCIHPMSDAQKHTLSLLRTGTTASKETRKKMSQTRKGRTQSEDHVRRRADARRGKTWNDEQRERASAVQKERFALYGSPLKGIPKSPEHAAKNRQNALNAPKLTCPHCAKVASIGNARRWHFDNCKLR